MKIIFSLIAGGFLAAAGMAPAAAFSLSPTDSLGAVNSDNGYLSLSTGTGDRAVSSLGTWLTGDKYSFGSYGKEGSGALWEGLANGVYEIDWEITTKDQAQADNLTFWNKRTAGVLGDNSLSTECVLLASGKCSTAQFTSDRQTSTVEVMYNQLALLGLDAVDTRGTSDIKVHGINRVSELSYDAPEVISLEASNVLGDVRLKDSYTAVTTGSKDRALSTVSDWIGQDLEGLGTEGSGALWEGLSPGRYELTWQVYASENDFGNDAFYVWNGEDLSEFTTRAIATNQRSKTRWDSEWMTSTIDIYGDTLGFLGLDTVDKSGTSELRISLLERIGDAGSRPQSEPAKTPEPSTALALSLLGLVKIKPSAIAKSLFKRLKF